MKKYSDKAHALLMAIVWTLSAILFIARTIWRIDPLLLVTAILATSDAAIWWITYVKKRQEEHDHE